MLAGGFCWIPSPKSPLFQSDHDKFRDKEQGKRQEILIVEGDMVSTLHTVVVAV